MSVALEQFPFIGERATRQRATPLDRTDVIADLVLSMILELEEPPVEEAGGIFLGTTSITAFYLGTVPVDTVYLGSTQVWPGTTEPPAFILEDDFTGTDGAAWNASKWEYQRDPSGSGTVTIQSNTGRVTGGGRPLAISAITVTDFELLVKINWANITDKYVEIGWRIGTNLSSGAPHLGYAVQIHEGYDVRMFLIDAYTPMGSTVSDTSLYGAKTVWVRVQSVGSNHKVRWWHDGSGEPGTWQMERTDATYTTGRLMLGAFTPTAVNYDSLQVTAL